VPTVILQEKLEKAKIKRELLLHPVYNFQSEGGFLQPFAATRVLKTPSA
jgi:hypothetical protein